ADGRHQAGRLQPGQRGETFASRAGPRLIGVVREEDVDRVEPEPVEALPQRPLDTRGREVPAPLPVAGNDEPVVVAFAGPGPGNDQTTHLCGHHELVARPAAQLRADPALGEAETVMRRGVEVADAAVPGP